MWISMDFNGFPSIRRLSLIFVYFRGWGVVAYVAREVASIFFSATVPALGISALFEDS